MIRAISQLKHPQRMQETRSSALVITLCMMVLLSGIVLAYLLQSTLNRKISFSSAAQERAQIVAETAMDVIVGDLRAEMANGSTTNTVNGTTILNPTNAFTMVPSTNGYGSVSGMTNLIKWSAGGVAFWPGTTNYATAGPIRAATGNLTTSPSVNGRYISIARWSRPELGTNGTSSSTPPWPPSWVVLTRSGVLTNSGGVVSSAQLSSLANSATNNMSYAVGRYAYTVYDEGALLDVAAAGYSGGSSNIISIGEKGSQGYADMTQLGLTQSQVDMLVNWRNATTAASSSNYTNYLGTFAPQYGFLRAASGDQAFVNRQDLINFCTTNYGTAAPVILQYLTTFSRENNAPSWGPLADAASMGGSNNGENMLNSGTVGQTLTGVYAYKDNATTNSGANSSATNVFLPQVQVTTSFTRLDGTTAVIGQPLIKYRFDLSKLAWIAHGGIPAWAIAEGVTAGDVMHYFGLTYSSSKDTWTYNNTSGSSNPGAGTSIMTLQQVAAAGREPDFFELLQAGILQGSLGSFFGDPLNANNFLEGEFKSTPSANGANFYYPPTFTRVIDANGSLVDAQEKYQIIQIGANLIDQVTTDNYPTEIILNGQSFYGIKNLPYFNAVGDAILRPTYNSAKPANPYTTTPSLANLFDGYMHFWLTFSLWNPHQNAASPPTANPTLLRIYAESGEAVPEEWGDRQGNPPNNQPTPGKDDQGVHFQSTSTGTPTALEGGNSPLYENIGPGWLGFTNTPGAFSEPTTLGYTNTFTQTSLDPTGGKNINDPYGRVVTSTTGYTATAWSRAGIYLGNSLAILPAGDIPLNSDFPSSSYYIPSAATGAGAGLYSCTTAFKFDLQYYDTTTSSWRTYQALNNFGFDPEHPHTSYWLWTTQNSDQGQENNLLDPRSTRMNTWAISLTSSGPNTNFYGNYVHSTGATYNNTPANYKYMGDWAFNNPSTGVSIPAHTPTYLADRDGVDRVGDASYWGTTANPMVPNQTAARPVILCRPFQNVAEMGYAFRDQPWKSLNLTSTNSPDAALLDLFCVGSSSVGNATPPSVVAGKVDINNAPQPVLAALISGANRLAQTTNTPSSVTPIGSADVSTLASAVTNYIATTGPLQSLAQLPAVFPQNSTTSTAEPGNKIQREALVRALSGSTSVRTWNLLIDVIAQSGRYKPNPSSLDDFVVEGEKHYWLHVAIDRFTGQIVDQTLEPVYEY